MKLKNGYILVYKPKHKYSKTKAGWIFEHRGIVEDYLKRALKQYEVVHHIDGNKKNNKIENLMIFQSQKEHIQFHLKIQQFGFTNQIKFEVKNRWKNLNKNEK